MEAYIKAISYYLPEKVLTNDMVAKEFPEWTEEKIEKKLGVRERHIAADDETASDLAIKAARKLFTENGINKASIDYLIFVTQSPDYFLPTSACLIQERLGLSERITAFDINMGCSGFVVGLSVAKAVIVGGQAKNVLLLTGETYSKYIHDRDKSNRTIFGDGAAATLVSTEGIAMIGEFVIGTDGGGANNLIVKSGGSRTPKPANDLEFDVFGNPRSSDYLYMDGPAMLNYTLDRIPSLAAEVLEKNGLTMDQIDLHVYHQANSFLANMERKVLEIPQEKFYCDIEKTGNTVSSTIPIALCESMSCHLLKKGSVIMSLAQGLGYSWGGVVLFF